jgi:hypothetical protein
VVERLAFRFPNYNRDTKILREVWNNLNGQNLMDCLFSVVLNTLIKHHFRFVNIDKLGRSPFIGLNDVGYDRDFFSRCPTKNKDVIRKEKWLISGALGATFTL